MAHGPEFTIVSFTVEKELLSRFKLLHPRFGETSRVIRKLLRKYVAEKAWMLRRKKRFPATV